MQRKSSLPRFAPLGPLLFGALVVGCGKSGENSAPSGELYELTLLGTEVCPSPPGVDPKKKLFGTRVRLTGRAAEGVPANYFYASLVASGGERYLAEHPGCSPVLSGKPLYSGESREGYLNFPIPKDQIPESLVYLPQIGRHSEKEALSEIRLNGPSLGHDDDDEEENARPNEEESP